jgi:hypothetical protein
MKFKMIKAQPIMGYKIDEMPIAWELVDENGNYRFVIMEIHYADLDLE